ncbi:MAG TPA: methyltransferase domain-containing protein [Gaiellaceae bacterium]|nr:methyltransferase domain-containing protein [Gaiellaceae bacterium]
MTLYGEEQSRFARYLEHRERTRPDLRARELRRALLAGLSGRVIEVGSGDGRSFEHYPAGVTSLLAVEPDPTARAGSADLVAAAAIPIEIVAGDAEALPAGDESFDAAVVMGLLCSVPEQAAALREIRRVLKPRGELRFWEHVRSENRLFRGVQHAIDSIFWTRSLGGCRTTRDTEAAIRAAGFEPETVDHGFHSSSVLTITSAPYIHGVARR